MSVRCLWLCSVASRRLSKEKGGNFRPVRPNQPTAIIFNRFFRLVLVILMRYLDFRLTDMLITCPKCETKARIATSWAITKETRGRLATRYSLVRDQEVYSYDSVNGCYKESS